MQIYKKLDNGIMSLIAESDAKRLLVIVESQSLPTGYSTEKEPGPANIFDNLHAKWTARFGYPVNLGVLSLKESFIRESSPSKVIKTVNTYTKILAKKMGISSSKVGVIICATDLAKSLSKDCYDYLNTIIRNPEETTGLPYPFHLPIKSRFAYTVSIPSHLWLKSGSIKEDGAGINLMGFVVRAAEVVLFRQSEGSIYQRMKDYHAGLYGEFKIVNTRKRFDRMMKDLRSKKYISIDTEAESLARINNTIIAHQYVTVNNETDVPKMWVLPFYHFDSPWRNSDIKYIKKRLRKFYEEESASQIHVYQNAKFDIHQHISLLKLRWYAADIYDVSAGSFSLEENQKFMKLMNTRPYALEHIEGCMEYKRPADLVIRKADRGKMATFKMIDIARYGVIDVLTPLFIMFEQIKIAKNRGYPQFSKFVRKQIGVMLFAMTEMEHNGIQVDIEYLREIASPIGPLSDQIREAAAKLSQSKAAQDANDVLLQKSSYQNRGLFGAAKKPQVWNIRDTKHLALLFFEVLGLDPLGFKANGEGKLNSAFQKVYRHTQEVGQYTTYQKLVKLKSAFATAIYKIMMKHVDMKMDHRLRPTFTYTDVLTGRSSTIKPSTQQLPTHGSLAKTIKKQFRVKPKRIRGKSDFQGHEVRVSGNLSLDPAICRAVDTVNEVQFNFRIAAEGKELEKATTLLKEEGDLHVQNYFTFYEIKIDKKDERRQDAKSAVFAVTYGSLAKSIGKAQHLAALFAVEDSLLNTELSEKDRRAMEKKLRWLRSEEGEEFYFKKATALLEVLRKKWGVLTDYIEVQQAEALVNNVVFGPHFRPRHLWGYLHFDRFVHFAMNRRVFNSLSQGYASDYGYTSIYLEKKVYWDLFESRGYPVDILQDNAVHDSSMSDMDFRFIPLYTYVREHSMISLTQRYYKKFFGITPKSQYGFDIEFGVHEADMEAWNQRPEGLVSIIEKYAPQSGVSDKVKEEVLHDWKILSRLRWHELHSKDVWNMSLEQDNVWESIVPRLKMFK